MFFEDEKFSRNQFTGLKINNATFFCCDFSRTDLTETEFIDCKFYDKNKELGCCFSHSVMKDTCFKNCDLTMANFKNVDALGLEIRGCLAQGVDFRGANFKNMITARSWFCCAYITKTNLSYANLSGVVLEKCELWENRWHGTIVTGATFKGADLSGGEFSSFNWELADFTDCDLTNSDLGYINARKVNLQGVKLDSEQARQLVGSLDVIIIG